MCLSYQKASSVKPRVCLCCSLLCLPHLEQSLIHCTCSVKNKTKQTIERLKENTERYRNRVLVESLFLSLYWPVGTKVVLKQTKPKDRCQVRGSAWAQRCPFLLSLGSPFSPRMSRSALYPKLWLLPESPGCVFHIRPHPRPGDALTSEYFGLLRLMMLSGRC